MIKNKHPLLSYETPTIECYVIQSFSSILHLSSNSEPEELDLVDPFNGGDIFN